MSKSKLISSIALIFLVYSSAAFATDSWVTLVSRGEAPYFAEISLRDAGKNSAGKRMIDYKIELSSLTCKSTFSGNALLDSEDYSELEGSMVKEDNFKGTGENGNITISMDVKLTDIKSHYPQAAHVDIEGAKITKGGCIRATNIKWNFYHWDTYYNQRN